MLHGWRDILTLRQTSNGRVDKDQLGLHFRLKSSDLEDSAQANL